MQAAYSSGGRVLTRAVLYRSCAARFSACSAQAELSARTFANLTGRRGAESVPRAVASESLSIGLLIETRSLPLAVLIRRRGVRLSSQRFLRRAQPGLSRR